MCGGRGGGGSILLLKSASIIPSHSILKIARGWGVGEGPGSMREDGVTSAKYILLRDVQTDN